MRFKKYDYGKIVEAYKNGESLNEICKKFGCHPVTIFQILKQESDLSYRQYLMSYDEKESIKSLYLSGQTVTEIGRKLAKHRETVRCFLQREGIYKKKYIKSSNIENPKKLFFEKNKDAIIDVFKSGCAIFSIAKKFDISRSYLSVLLIEWLGKEEFEKIRNHRKLLKKESKPTKDYKPRVRKLKKNLNFEEKFSMKLAEKVYFMYFGGLSYEKIASYFHITIEQVSYCVDFWKNHLKKTNN